MKCFQEKRIIAGIPGCRLLLLPILLMVSGLIASGQSDTLSAKVKTHVSQKNDVSLFGTEDILNVTIYLDLGRFSKKPSRTDTFEARMIINPGTNDSIARDITIKYRGISRYELCSFPPMQINFKKPIYSDSSKIRKLKLVTHCQPSELNDEYVLREYLVYKIFGAMTDTSFRVRLLKVNYIDSKGNKKTIRKYGIFIEPAEMLAKRTSCISMSTVTVNQSRIIPSVMDRLSIFNYMVTNWDWSIPGQHNVEVIKPMSYNTDGKVIAVPYDFDLTGVVNADYAIPPPDLGIENVRQPIFTGICRTRAVYAADLKRFADAKPKIYSVVNDFPYLNQRAKKDISYFLDNFFDQLEKPKSTDRLIDIFLENCK